MLSVSVRTPLRAELIEEAALSSLPESVFGHDEWAAGVIHQLTEHLLDAVGSGQLYQFANAIQLVAHVPTAQDVRAIVNAVCDAATTHAAVCGQESDGLRLRVSQLRMGANEILDRTLVIVPHRSTPAEVVTACETLLQLVSVSRTDLRKHLEAVSSLGVRIGRQLDLADETLESIRLGGLLHDVGLLTTGTDPALAERDPGHMTLADRCLAGIDPLRYLAPIVRAHHERFDGTGQPDGLRSAEIPIEARIIAVADAFEHLANRPGRSNPVAAAVSELWQESGTFYDPDVVAAVTRLFNQHWHVHRTASGAP